MQKGIKGLFLFAFLMIYLRRSVTQKESFTFSHLRGAWIKDTLEKKWALHWGPVRFLLFCLQPRTVSFLVLHFFDIMNFSCHDFMKDQPIKIEDAHEYAI